MVKGKYEGFSASGAKDLVFSAWVEVGNWNEVLRRLMDLKFALQADRDKIPGVLSDLNMESPFTRFKRFSDGEEYALLIKEANIAIAQIQAASAFKRRADEKNAVSGLLTQSAQQPTSSIQGSSQATVVRPPRESDSAFAEDNFSFGKFDDASTAFHKARSYLRGLRLVALDQEDFEEKFKLVWKETPQQQQNVTGPTVPATSSGGGKGPGVA
ncbi:unnamed protein product [Pea early-browning virus]|uniref:Coat protein n=1 Tax=Pea early browning virus TaxID=12294 RepID=COAT_PEBV|nr:coat protein [Pea early-browning virus]P14849.1 RecName: Full=Coat protein; AltName: Full=Capsid protein [Pea early-browning virus]AEJ83863.1 coat protein [Virus-induced gene silencing vector pCAPE2-PsPDS]CAA33892.1 unnamed protein product [Pea early-browning virus]CAA36125.1 unnamed protein product [Pea early-browning virus]